MPGFEFAETMTGTYRREGEERPIRFQLRARVGSVTRHLADRRADIEGTVDADGLATNAALDGWVIIDPLLGRKIRYEFTFHDDGGRPLRFEGQKDVSLLDPLGSMTTLPAEIKDDGGRVVATALVRFDLRDLPSFLASFRPVL